jgi:hypothetical protein
MTPGSGLPTAVGIKTGNISCTSLGLCVAVVLGSPNGSLYASSNDGSSWTEIDSWQSSATIADPVISCYTGFLFAQQCVLAGGNSVLDSSNGGGAWTFRGNPANVTDIRSVSCWTFGSQSISDCAFAGTGPQGGVIGYDFGNPATETVIIPGVENVYSISCDGTQVTDTNFYCAALGTANGVVEALTPIDGGGFVATGTPDGPFNAASDMAASCFGATCGLVGHSANGAVATNMASVKEFCSTQPVDYGYTTVASDGGIFNFGGAPFCGSAGSIPLNRPIVGMAQTAQGGGYWLVASDGGVFSYGDAQFYGSTGGMRLNKPIVGIASTRDGHGYWLVASDGGIFAFGDALFEGSTGSIHLNQPIVGMAATPGGSGYWLVASDGGVFNFGDAQFYGSAGSVHLSKPIVGISAGPRSSGYWLVASDGGVFSYGSAHFYGSAGSIAVNQPIVGMASTQDSGGYWLVAADGGIFSYGDAAFKGSTGGIPLNRPVVGMVAG